MKTNETMKIDEFLYGAEIIPLPKKSLQDLLASKHLILNVEAEDGESDVACVKRLADKVLKKISILMTKRRCLIIHTPAGQEKLSNDAMDLLESYMGKWMIGEVGYRMDWGVYTDPNSSRLRITIVTNVPNIRQQMVQIGVAVLLGVTIFVFSLHYMEFGMDDKPIRMGLFEYVKSLTWLAFNKYAFFSVLFWLTGWLVLLYSLLPVNKEIKK